MKKRMLTWLIALIYFSLTVFVYGCNPQQIAKTPLPSDEAAQSSSATSSEFGKINFAKELKKVVDVPFKSVQINASVAPYSVNSDLSNITNLVQYGEFTLQQKLLLSKNAFVVSPTQEEQLFYIYEKNEYLKIPNFVTTDSVLQIYHIFYDYTLRNLESDQLLGLLEEFTQSMLKKSLDIYNAIENPEVKTAAFKNAAIFAVAQLLLQKPLTNIPPDISALAEKEYALIKDEGGFQKSSIFPYSLDYSQFKPRGHYTRSEDFSRYFRAMMWYGQAPFPLYKDMEEKERNVEQTLQALLITYMIFLENTGTPDRELWEKIYEPTAFFVGKSDDLTIYDYQKLLSSVYGDNIDIEKLNDPAKLGALYEAAKKLPEPKIQAQYSSVDTPVGKQFRVMGQRYIPDSEIIQKLVAPPMRPIPSGLDIMAALGSNRAAELQLQKEENAWEGYPAALKKMKEQCSNIPDSTWRSNMYYGWLWTLSSFSKPFGSGYPSFMTNEAWDDKSLNTALGSWSELRHDTILYGKQSGAECGGEEAPKLVGYVEPSVEVYERLLWLTRYSKESLDQRGLLSNEVRDSVQRFEDLLNFLITCSVKELRNEELSQDEYNQILTYGGLLEYLTSSLSTDEEIGSWYEITSEADKNMALIADFHTLAPNAFSDGGYMEAGVGPAQEIYVVVPIGGKLVLTRGAVFSYYEFLNSTGTRLTDEEWQAMIKAGNQPPVVPWSSSFTAGGNSEIPVPAEPYNSGC